MTLRILTLLLCMLLPGFPARPAGASPRAEPFQQLRGCSLPWCFQAEPDAAPPGLPQRVSPILPSLATGCCGYDSFDNRLGVNAVTGPNARIHHYDGKECLPGAHDAPETASPLFGNARLRLDALHKYLYCHASPINGIDPSGHDFCMVSMMSATGIGQALESMYNSGVVTTGNALQATLFGIQAGQGMNEILTGFLLDETGVGLAVDAYQSMKGYFQTEEDKAMAACMLWQEEVIATIVCAMEDSESGETSVKFEPQCFLAGTPVVTQDGLKPIEEIKPGDNVWAWNEAADELALRPVLNRFVHQRNEIFEIRVGWDTLKVTGEHPFYVSGKGWIPSREVQVGDQFVTSDDRTLVVDSVERWSGDFLVYNFEVSTDHNYYVGEEGVLTHNMNALRAAMKLKNPLLAAHRIVAIRAGGAARARDLLKEAGILVDDIRNGVALPRNLKAQKKFPGMPAHSIIHTKKYYDELTRRLNAAFPEKRVEVMLNAAYEIQIGTFPFR